MEQTNFTQTKLNTVDDVLRPRFKLSTTDRDYTNRYLIKNYGLNLKRLTLAKQL